MFASYPHDMNMSGRKTHVDINIIKLIQQANHTVNNFLHLVCFDFTTQRILPYCTANTRLKLLVSSTCIHLLVLWQQLCPNTTHDKESLFGFEDVFFHCISCMHAFSYQYPRQGTQFFVFLHVQVGGLELRLRLDIVSCSDWLK